MRTIRKIAVLGAGVMGSQIAAHFANAGIPALLLDIVPGTLKPGESRSKIAADAIGRLAAIRPSPIMHPSVPTLLTPGNLEDDLGRIAEVDWVIEAVVERLDIKLDLWRRVAEHARPGTILSTNTSGLSIAAQVEALPDAHRPNFLGTHFFNPPRYLKLLEIIPVATTDPEVTRFVAEFGERVLGKGVVIAQDTPNFIANRIGTFGIADALRVMAELGLGIDAVDAITGPVIGHATSATFRTLDIVGLDTFVHVARNTATATDDPAERDLFQLPPAIEEMVKRGWIGEKTGQGFFKRERGADGETQILTLDLATLEYRPRARVSFPSLEQVRNVSDPGERIRLLIQSPDPAGQFVWRTLRDLLVFSATKADEIADGDVNAIDRAMRWGFNWEIGPFETWNAIGVQDSIRRMESEGVTVPEWVKGVNRFPIDRSRESPLSFAILKRDRTVKKTPSVTLVDLGDEVLGLEFHGPKQAIGPDYISAARSAAEEVRKNWRGLVISATAPNFCVGANIAMMLLEAQDENWDDVDRVLRDFQNLNMQLKYFERPVVVAPYAITVGGGAEVVMHCARTVAAAESYLGLVEVGVGLIPAGGGTKELAVRAARALAGPVTQLPNRPELISFLAPLFETIATAKVSTSAAEARDLGYLRGTDRIVMNGDHLLAEAKETVLALDREGYQPPVPGRYPIAGPDGRAVLEFAAYTLRQGGYATDHDLFIARKLAYVMTGGDLPAGTLVPEQYLLDLERQAFLELIRHPKSQARMSHMLQRNRPLRN